MLGKKGYVVVIVVVIKFPFSNKKELKYITYVLKGKNSFFDKIMYLRVEAELWTSGGGGGVGGGTRGIGRGFPA